MGATTVDIFPLIKDTVDNVFKQRLQDREQRAKVVTALMLWLTVKARKKDVPDLDERLKRIEARVKKMVDNMVIEIKDDKPVVKVSGSDEDAWKMFRLGTGWFEPNPDLIETVLSGLFNE